MSHRSMFNERDARHDARMKQSRNDWAALGLVLLAFVVAAIPVALMLIL